MIRDIGGGDGLHTWAPTGHVDYDTAPAVMLKDWQSWNVASLWIILHRL